MSMSYVTFSEAPTTTKTGRWKVHGTNNGVLLGTIKFYGRWRCFTFHPEPGTLFNEGCLNDIAAFCKRVTDEWRKGLARV